MFLRRRGRRNEETVKKNVKEKRKCKRQTNSSQINTENWSEMTNTNKTCQTDGYAFLAPTVDPIVFL